MQVPNDWELPWPWRQLGVVWFGFGYLPKNGHKWKQEEKGSEEKVNRRELRRLGHWRRLCHVDCASLFFFFFPKGL